MDIQDQQLSQEINRVIDNGQNFLIISHHNPDGDALGSLSAFWHYLAIKHKNCCVFFDGDFCDYGILPPLSDYFFQPSQQDHFDGIIILDAGDLDHCHFDLANFFDYFSRCPVINIDHHLSNIFFGDFNLVNPHASSACEILNTYFKAINFSISPKMASALLLGIVFDTQNFFNLNTTAECLAASSYLLLKGADRSRVLDSFAKNWQDLRLCGEVFDQIIYNSDLNTAYIIIKQAMRYRAHNPEVIESVSNIFNNISELEFAFVLREEGEDNLKISLRTNRQDVNVANLAKFFGGGGHQKAAGFNFAANLAQQPTGWSVE